MALPTTPILDSFTGTNGDNLSTRGQCGWTVGSGFASECEIQGNAATGTAASSGVDFLINDAYGPMQEVYCTVTARGIDGQTMGFFLRCNGTAGATLNGYFLEITPVAGVDEWRIYRFDVGVATLIGGALTSEIVVNDLILFQAIENSQFAYQNGVAIVGARDATYPTTTRIALVITGTTWRIDDFGGGTIPNPITNTGRRHDGFIYGRPYL